MDYSGGYPGKIKGPGAISWVSSKEKAESFLKHHGVLGIFSAKPGKLRKVK